MSGNDRNQSCFCGSGIKFKKCHLLFDEKIQNPNSFVVSKIPIYKTHEVFSFNRKYELCLASKLKGCSNNIINAHTLPKSSSLGAIAENGHIYTFKNRDFINFNKNDGIISPQKIGVNLASTFRGFCSIHDDQLFSSLEKQEFKVTEKQCFMLFYRAYSLEFYNKKIIKNTFPFFVKKILSINDKLDFLRKKKFFEYYVAGTNFALNSLEKNHNKLTNYIENICFYAIKLNDVLPIMGVGAFAPQNELDGSLLQDLSDISSDERSYICLSIFVDKAGFCWIVYSWLKEHNKINEKFLRQILECTDTEKIKISLNILLNYIENIYIKISYWDSLNNYEQKYMIEKFNVFSNVTVNRIFKKNIGCQFYLDSYSILSEFNN